MGLHKGMTNNKAGRPLGKENLTSKETKKLLLAVLSKEFEKIPDYLEQIKDPEKKLNIIIRLLPYIVPRVEPEKYNFENGWSL